MRVKIICNETKKEFDTIKEAAEWLISLPRCKSKSARNIAAYISKHINNNKQTSTFGGRRYTTGNIKSVYGFTFTRIEETYEKYM